MHAYHLIFCVKTRKLIDNCYLELYPKMILVLSFDDESFICTGMECYLGKRHSGTLVIIYPLLCNVSLNIIVKQ